MNTEFVGKKVIQITNSIVNFTMLMIIILMLAFAGYALWDSKQLYQAADKSHYEVYKPTVKNEGKSFKELQALNAEVFAWLSVYGTNIDYPVTQSKDDNMKYVNTNAEGLYSLSGSIFLDCNNSMGFSDFNSILYGHHMEKKTMFGEIGTFSDKNVFDSHRYANLYYDAKDHGIEFFAFVHTDAYDSSVFTPGVQETARQAYLNNLLAKAMHTRELGITIDDRIIMLSTCSASSTNGRDILIGKLTDEAHEDPFINMEANGRRAQLNDGDPYCIVKQVPLWPFLLILLLTAQLFFRFFVTYDKLGLRQ
jgi:sortase B